MPTRIIPDTDQPSIAIEIPLETTLPDYDLEELDQPTPRDVDGILVSQGFRDLVDDAHGVLKDILTGTSLEVTQLTGAICPGDEGVYRPGLWIVLRDSQSQKGAGLPPEAQQRVAAVAAQFVKRMSLA
jgi:hypothetical protein